MQTLNFDRIKIGEILKSHMNMTALAVLSNIEKAEQATTTQILQYQAAIAEMLKSANFDGEEPVEVAKAMDFGPTSNLFDDLRDPTPISIESSNYRQWKAERGLREMIEKGFYKTTLEQVATEDDAIVMLAEIAKSDLNMDLTDSEALDIAAKLYEAMSNFVQP
jgi:hypothetical protein